LLGFDPGEVGRDRQREVRAMQSSFRPVAMRLPLSLVAALAEATALLFRPSAARLALAFRLPPPGEDNLASGRKPRWGVPAAVSPVK
jgi:hypothetical protein